MKMRNNKYEPTHNFKKRVNWNAHQSDWPKTHKIVKVKFVNAHKQKYVQIYENGYCLFFIFKRKCVNRQILLFYQKHF